MLIIGLDGAGWPLLERLFAAHRMPTLQRLAESGLRAELRSTLPPATLPAWTSFLTGAGPGTHGVVDIFMREAGTYRLRPASGHDRRLPTFLARLSEAGLRVASIGVPGTYPPEEVNGLCVAGFDAPGAVRPRRGAVWPPRLHAELEALGGWRYATFNEQARGPRRLRRAVRALQRDVAAKERVLLALLRQQPWDVFFVHLQASDTAAHHLWHTFDLDSPRHTAANLAGALPRVYARLDRLICRLVNASGPGTRLLLVSDHGMGGASTRVIHLNRWLAERHLLAFRRGAIEAAARGLGQVARGAARLLPRLALGAAVQLAPQLLLSGTLSLARHAGLDPCKTLAFSDELDYAPSIWLHRREVFEHGCVDRHEVGPLRQRLRADLLALTDPDSGERLIDAVHEREQVLSGPHVDLAPDLLIEPAWPRGYRSSFLRSHGPGPALRCLAPSDYAAAKGAGLPGVHHRQGVFVATGPGLPVAELPAVDIAVAGALVYPLLDLPVPADIEVAIPEAVTGLVDVRYAPDGKGQARRRQAYSEQEAAAVTERLRQLGYID